MLHVIKCIVSFKVIQYDKGNKSTSIACYCFSSNVHKTTDLLRFVEKDVVA